MPFDIKLLFMNMLLGQLFLIIFKFKLINKYY